MARSDMQYGPPPKMSTSRRRISSDSVTRSRAKKDLGSTYNSMDNSWAPEDSTIPPSGLTADGLHEPIPFPEYPDTQSPGYKERDPMTSARNPSNRTASDSWSSNLNESSDALDYRLPKNKHMKPKVHIKPMLRKMSRDDAPSTSIDLSRSSAEQEGLGIYLSMERDRRQSESLTGTNYRRSSGLHHRSTSGTSQFSTGTGSSGGRSGSQYVHPMRPTPKVYTPPLSESYQTSGNNSDELDDDGLETDSTVLPTSESPRYVRASSGPVPRLSLQIEDDSFTRLSGTSQTNIASRPSLNYSRDTGGTFDTASPTSRTSFDHMFRSRTRTSTDPISRAATIQAARQAFEEREAAKNRRLEKQQLKAEERQTRRRVKLKSASEQDSPVMHSSEEFSEKPNSSQLPKRAEKEPQAQGASWKSQSKSTWVLFMTWLRTRVFKFRRKLRR